MAGLNHTLRKLTCQAIFLTALAWAGVASAQFIGVSVDAAIAYSATNVAAESMSGGSVGITHPIPFVPNIGGTSLTFTETESSSVTSPSTSSLTLKTTVEIKTVNIFYHVPFPVVTMALGVGYGRIKTAANAVLDSTTEDLSNKDYVTEGFIHIGLPFYNMLEFHLGYHAINAPKIDRLRGTSKDYSSHTDSNIDQKKSYTGGMTTVGLQIAF